VKSATATVRLFEEHGFTLARSKNHLIWNCPCGHARVTTSTTGGYGRGSANAAAQIKRTLRACTTEGSTTP
jgi:hypothetical protein